MGTRTRITVFNDRPGSPEEHLAILATTPGAIPHKLAKRLGHELLARRLGRVQRRPSFRLQEIQQAADAQISFEHDSIRR